MAIEGERSEFDIFVGTRIGSFKHIKYHKEQTLNDKKCVENLQEISSLQKEDTITSLTWVDQEQDDLLIGRANQVVQTYNTSSGIFKHEVNADHGKGAVVGLYRMKRKLVTALSDGTVRVWGKRQHDMNVGEIDRLRCCPDDTSVFATGGKERDLRIWSVGETEPRFVAKNVRHDSLELRRPVWVTDMCFLPGGTTVACCSRYATVRIYDMRAQRRPVSELQTPNMAATCISRGLGDNQYLVGFARGQLHNVDFRGKPHLDKGYKGGVGAVTAAELVPGEPYVVSVGLDRHLKVHHAVTKKLLHKQYLTSKLTQLLVQTARGTPLTKVKAKEEEKQEEKDEIVAVESDDQDDMDELFDNMENVGVKRKRKSGKRTPGEATADSDVEIKSEESDQEDGESKEEKIARLLKATEKKKRRMEKEKKKKKAKSIFHNA